MVVIIDPLGEQGFSRASSVFADHTVDKIRSLLLAAQDLNVVFM